MLCNCRIKLHHSWYQSFIHWLQPSYGDSWPCWLPKMNCVVDISNWLFSPSQMTCYDVQSCLAFSEEHRWHSCFLRGHCLGRFNLSCQQRNPQVIESQTWVCWDTYKTVYSNGPILCRYLVATSKASMRSVNRDRGSGAWVWGPETKPTLPLEIITKRCLLFLCAACQTESAQINCF